MDAQTFQREALQHEKLLYHISYALLRSSQDCADAIQEALLRAWQSRDTLKSMDAFRPWLCRILANTCKDMLRRKRRVTFVPLEEEMPDQREQGDGIALREALDRLSPEQRACITMYYLDGLSVGEISQTLSLPEGTVKSRLAYGRNHLESLLREVNV